MSLLPKSADPQLQTVTTELGNSQRPTFPLFSGVPLSAEVPEKGIVFANVGGTRRLYTKLDAILYHVDLVP